VSDIDEFALGPTIEFMRSLWRLNHALERLSRRMEAAWGVTAQQRMIIRCVGRYPGMTAGQLAGQLYVDAGTVSTALNRLERKGLLERRRAERDRRRLTLGLTVTGRALDREAGTLEHAVERLLREAGSEDISCTRRVLESLTHCLEAEGFLPNAPRAAAPSAPTLPEQRDATDFRRVRR
jgi:MarR family transcriptional regulator, organic hydroperoxide resistance regulator